MGKGGIPMAMSVPTVFLWKITNSDFKENAIGFSPLYPVGKEGCTHGHTHINIRLPLCLLDNRNGIK